MDRERVISFLGLVSQVFILSLVKYFSEVSFWVVMLLFVVPNKCREIFQIFNSREDLADETPLDVTRETEANDPSIDWLNDLSRIFTEWLQNMLTVERVRDLLSEAGKVCHEKPPSSAWIFRNIEVLDFSLGNSIKLNELSGVTHLQTPLGLSWGC